MFKERLDSYNIAIWNLKIKVTLGLMIALNGHENSHSKLMLVK